MNKAKVTKKQSKLKSLYSSVTSKGIQLSYHCFLQLCEVPVKVESTTMQIHIEKNSLSMNLLSKSTGPVKDFNLHFEDKKLKHQATT